MPQIFNNAVMTNAGRALLSKEMAGECMIQITRMAVGNGVYTDAEKNADALQTMTELKCEVQSSGLSSLKRIDGTSVMVSGVFANDAITADYHMNEIGLFAQEKGNKSTEILYSIAVVSGEGEIMPASDGKNPVRIIQDWIVTVSNSENATIESLPDGAYAMAADMGNVDELNTKEKGTVVGAINETLRRLIVKDTSGLLGTESAEVEAQNLLDEIADSVKEKLLKKTGDSAENTVTFGSSDSATANAWTDVPVMESGEKHKSLFGKISTMVKNVRYLYKVLGSEDISQMGDGTVTGILTALMKVAFTGKYSDLTGVPTSLKNPQALTFTGAVTGNYDGSAAKSVGIPSVTNNDLATIAGTAWDAVRGKQIRTDLTALQSQVTQINSDLSGKDFFNIILKRNYDYKEDYGWANLIEWYDRNVRTGYLLENVSNGKVTLYLNNLFGDIVINHNSIADIATNINALKNGRNWINVLSQKVPGTYTINNLSTYNEILFVYGYVLQSSRTILIPKDIFPSGSVIITDDVSIGYVDDTHVTVTKPSDDYLVRMFVR